MLSAPRKYHIAKKEREKAFLLYLGGRDASEIALALKLDIEVLRYHIFGVDGTGRDSDTWYHQKAVLRPSALALYLHDKITVLDSIAGVGIEILSDSLAHLRDKVKSKEIILSAKEIGELSKVVTGIDKMVRLEKGESTEIFHFLGLSVEESRAIIQNDPFAVEVKNEGDVIDAEYVETPWLDSGDGIDESGAEEEDGESVP